jgi:hypothetical protein
MQGKVFFRGRQSRWYNNWKSHRFNRLSPISLTGIAILAQKKYQYLNGHRIHLLLSIATSLFLILKFFLKIMFRLSFRNTGKGRQQCNNGIERIPTIMSYF